MNGVAAIQTPRCRGRRWAPASARPPPPTSSRAVPNSPRWTPRWPACTSKLVHSPHAHARIVSVDKTAALAVPGVHRVYTWEDVPRKRFNAALHTDHLVDPDDTYILDDVARFVGQRMAAVLADTVAAAERNKPPAGHRAMRSHPWCSDPEQAMQPGAPALHGFDDLPA